MRYPGVVLGADEALCPPLPKLVAAQIKESAGCWPRTGAWLTSLIFVKSSYDFHPAAGHAAAIGALKDIGLAGVVESAEIGTLRFGRPWARSSRSTGGFSGGLLRYRSCESAWGDRVDRGSS